MPVSNSNLKSLSSICDAVTVIDISSPIWGINPSLNEISTPLILMLLGTVISLEFSTSCPSIDTLATNILLFSLRNPDETFIKTFLSLRVLDIRSVSLPFI